MPIACFCIVDPKDEIRFIDYYIKSSDYYLLKFQAFASLQYILPLLQKRLNGQTADPYLGYMNSVYLPDYEYDVYGYVTVSQYKFILFVIQSEKSEKMNMQSTFEQLYNGFKACNYNPFGKSDLQKYLKPIIKNFND